MIHEINTNGLSAGEKKELLAVLRAYGDMATVKRVRAHCSPGPVMAAVYAVLVCGVFLLLGMLFWPFWLLAALALPIVPMLVMMTRPRWLQLLPPERDDYLVALV